MFYYDSRFSPGILVIGGGHPKSAYKSVEFWSTAEPKKGRCMLSNYTLERGALTANLVSGKLVACYGTRCEIYLDGKWNHLVFTT